MWKPHIEFFIDHTNPKDTKIYFIDQGFALTHAKG